MLNFRGNQKKKDKKSQKLSYIDESIQIELLMAIWSHRFHLNAIEQNLSCIGVEEPGSRPRTVALMQHYASLCMVE